MLKLIIQTIIIILAIIGIMALCIFFFPDLEAKEIDYSQFSDSEIVEAIGKAENSVKYPYGIKSINTNGNVTYARQICLNSVRNGRARWIKAGRPCDLIEFISRRYCPINAPDDNGTNKYWSRNVKYFLNKARER